MPASGRLPVVLGLMTATGPFAIDMYLPAFASIARDLHAGPGAVQNSLVSFFVALAVGQMIYGPVSDMIGRRTPLLFGLGLFIVVSIACIFVRDATTLVVLRFFQGLGGCAGMVLSRAVIRDLHDGEAAARLFASTLLVLGISPVFAPLVGSLIATHLSWRVIFVAVALIGALATALVVLYLPETRPPSKRQTAGLRHAGRLYAALLRDPWFLSAVLTAGFAQGAFFAYIAGSAFVFISVFGIPPIAYSVIFAMNAIALIGGAQLVAPLMRRVGIERMMGTAVGCFTAITLILALLGVANVLTVAASIGLVFAAIACLGFIMTPAAVLALRPHGAVAGTASALMGTFQFALGAFASFLVSTFFDNSARPLFVIMAGGALAAAASWQVFLHLDRRNVALRPCSAERGS